MWCYICAVLSMLLHILALICWRIGWWCVCCHFMWSGNWISWNCVAMIQLSFCRLNWEYFCIIVSGVLFVLCPFTLWICLWLNTIICILLMTNRSVMLIFEFKSSCDFKALLGGTSGWRVKSVLLDVQLINWADVSWMQVAWEEKLFLGCGRLIESSSCYAFHNTLWEVLIQFHSFGVNYAGM